MVEYVSNPSLSRQNSPQTHQLLSWKGEQHPGKKYDIYLFSALQGHFQKNLRRTVMRYVNLSTILVYRLVSKKVEYCSEKFFVVTKLSLALLT